MSKNRKFNYLNDEDEYNSEKKFHKKEREPSQTKKDQKMVENELGYNTVKKQKINNKRENKKKDKERYNQWDDGWN